MASGMHFWRAGLRMHPPVDIIGGKRPQRERRPEQVWKPPPEEKKVVPAKSDRTGKGGGASGFGGGANGANGGSSGGDGDDGNSGPFRSVTDYEREMQRSMYENAVVKVAAPRGLPKRRWDRKTWRPIGVAASTPHDQLLPATPRHGASPRSKEHALIAARRRRRAGHDEPDNPREASHAELDSARLAFDTPSRRLACRTDDGLTFQIEKLLWEAHMHPTPLLGLGLDGSATSSPKSAAAKTPSPVARRGTPGTSTPGSMSGSRHFVSDWKSIGKAASCVASKHLTR